VLGVINGLLIGLFAEEARVIYLAHAMSRARSDFELRHPDWAVDFFYPDRSLLVPLVCVVALAGAGHLIRRYFVDYPRTLLWFWSAIGAVALCAGYLMAPPGANVFSLVWVLMFAAVSYSAHRLWARHPESLPLLWLVVGVSAVLVVAAAAQLIGLFTVQRHELRSSFLWLLCLTLVVIVNPIYGAAAQLLFQRHRPTWPRTRLGRR
jgi:hypothetical protein